VKFGRAVFELFMQKDRQTTDRHTNCHTWHPW